MKDEPLILDQPWQIELYRLQSLKHALRLEIKHPGMRVVRGSLVNNVNQTLIRNGFTKNPVRTKKAALKLLEEYITMKEEEAIKNAQ